MTINKAKIFDNELRYIIDEHIREVTRQIVCELPDYFFTVAASSTGKYHPAYALGEGGLVRHTKAAVKIGNSLLSLEYNQDRFSQDERDIICAALVLHDGMKHGTQDSEYTVASHPIVMSEYIKSNHSGDFSDEQLKLIVNAISSHMGQWNTDFRTKKEIMPKPSTEIEYFVHLCDYLASRKWLDVDMSDDYYKPEDYKISESSEVVEAAKVDTLIASVIEVCKEKINNGANRNDIYKMIEDISGVKNPVHIKDINKAEEVLKAVKEI